jgi:hypothetical protein
MLAAPIPVMQPALPPHQIFVQHQHRIAPGQTIETTPKEKSLYEKSIDMKKQLNQYKKYIPKTKFNKLWFAISQDPFFDLAEELSKIKLKKRKSKGGALDEYDIYDFGEQKVGTIQPKPPKEKKTRKPSTRITTEQYNHIHDEMTMCHDENKYLQKYIRALERVIRKIQK